MKIHALKILLPILAIALSACSPLEQKPVQRFGMVTELRPEKATYYRELHAKPWPGVMKMLKQCHIRNYSIFEKEISGRTYLFSYFEYTGSDFSGDMKKMAADPETRRWWKETDPCQRPLPEAAKKKQIWSTMDSVFYLP